MSRLHSLIEPLEPRYAPSSTIFLGASAPDQSGTEDLPLSQSIAASLPTLTISDVSAVEGNGAGTSEFRFDVALSAEVMEPVTVSFQTQIALTDPATPGVDYTEVSGVLTFMPGGTLTQTISVQVTRDTVFELNEGFEVLLSNPSANASLLKPVGVGTIQNDDTQPLISIGDVSIVEGDAGTTQAIFTISLSNPSHETIEVMARTIDGTAISTGPNADFIAAALTAVTFDPGQTSKTFAVTINGDTTPELSEGFAVQLSDPVNATIASGGGDATGTITIDDIKLRIDPVAVQVGEGNINGTSKAIFTVRLEGGLTSPVSVRVATANGTAAAGQDFVGINQILTFAPGETEKTVEVMITGDLLIESNETFQISLSEPTGAVIAAGTATATIVTDDLQTISISDFTTTEGTGGTKPFTFTVTLSQALAEAVSVTFRTATVLTNSATPGQDYTHLSGILTFNPGDALTKTVTVQVTTDTRHELDETFEVILSEPTPNVTLLDAVGVGTIQNDDEKPKINIGDISIAEGNVGTIDAVFTLTLSNPSFETIQVSAATMDGTATSSGAAADFVAKMGSVVFNPGETSKTFVVSLNADTIGELSEDFFVKLTSPVNATLADGAGEAKATITNDDPTLRIDPSTIRIVEGNVNGTSKAVFTVRLESGPASPVSVNVATVNGTAVAGQDFTAFNQTLTFQPGEREKTVEIMISGDTTLELDETFQVVLSSPTNATITGDTAVTTIANDEILATISEAIQISEGDTTAGAFLTVKLSSAPVDGPVRVHFSIPGGTATLDQDYSLVVGDMFVDFGVGQTEKTINFNIIGDTRPGGDETILVTLTSATNASLGTAVNSSITLKNDDGQPTISITDVAVLEGDPDGTLPNTRTAVVTVTLSEASESVINATYATQDGTATLVDGDYVFGSNTITFAPGETTKQITITYNEDTRDEDNETLTVALTGVSSVVDLANSDVTSTITLTNDDIAPVLDILDVMVVEGDDGTRNAVFTFRLKVGENFVSASRPITIHATTEADTAVAGLDYTAFDGNVTFAPGQSQVTLSIPIVGDVADELDETFNLNITSPQNVVVLDAQAIATIQNDDLRILIDGVSVIEGNSGTKEAIFTLRLSAASLHPVSVTATTVDGTATVANGDYVFKTEVITFDSNTLTREFKVTINGDLTPELLETFLVNLTNPVNAQIAVGSAVGTIVNDEAAFRISDGRIIEGGPGNVAEMEFVITLENGPGTPVSVSYATQQLSAGELPSGIGAATADGDFTAINDTLTFAPGETSRTIRVPILGDAASESNELFKVVLTDQTAGVGLSDGEGRGTILDDDGNLAYVIAGDATIVEGDSGTAQMIFVVNLLKSFGTAVSVSFTLMDGTATQTGPRADFIATNGSFTFDPGVTSLTVSVPIVGDLAIEGDQNFFLKLTSTNSSVSFIDDTGEGTIVDNDDDAGAKPKVSVSGGSVVEGDAGESQALFIVTLDRASDTLVTVNFATSNGTATAGSDYTGRSTTITFAPGQTVQAISIPVFGDIDVESDETIVGTLTSPSANAELGTASSSNATIQDDEVKVTVADVSVTEGNSGTKIVAVTVTRAGSSTNPLNVGFTFAGLTATLESDFRLTGFAENAPRQVTFAPGVTTQTIEFLVVGDTRHEQDETFTVTLIDPAGAALGAQSTATVTIDNDDAVVVAVADQTVIEGDTTVAMGPNPVPKADAGPFISTPATVPAPVERNVSFTVTLSGVSDETITVKASTIAGMGAGFASEGSDYQKITDQLITFAPGETSKTVTIKIVDDYQTDEAAETFDLGLSDVTGGPDLSVDSGTITILDDDLRSVSIAAASVFEGASGTKELKFKITLPYAATLPITLTYSTVDAGATSTGAGADYVGLTNQTVMIPAGETEVEVSVTINGDTTPESDEAFLVRLTNAQNGVIVDGEAVGRIVTDEVTYTFENATLEANDDGTENQTVTFTVKRAGDNSLLATTGRVTYQTVDGTAKSTGALADYVAANGVIEFAPNQTTQTISVVVNKDFNFEDAESFILRLTSATNGTFAAGEVLQDQLDGTVTIAAGTDARPTFSIGDVQRAEGSSEAGQTDFVFTVSLSAANEKEVVTVDFATLAGTAISVAANGRLQDFVSQLGTLTFEKGETSKTITVKVNQDTRDEDQEAFSVNLSNAKVVNSTDIPEITDATGTGTITDDDLAPTIRFEGDLGGNVTVTEGNLGSAPVILKVILSGASEREISMDIDLATAVGAGFATEGVDFQAVTNLGQRLVFAPGQTEASVEFAVLGDTRDEVSETFTLELTNATNATIADGSAIVTITDDDAAPSLTINDVSIIEGNNGTSLLTFTVSLSGSSDSEITVDYATVDGTAKSVGAIVDFVSTSGVLTFAPGTTGTKTISVPINGDAFKESNETFTLALSNADNASILRSTGTGTIIQDGDTTVGLVISDARVVEGNSGQAQAVFVVELTDTSDTTVTFNAATRNGTAVKRADYTALNQGFTIPAGSLSTNVSVSVVGDSTFESTESFFVGLTGASGNVVVVDGDARGTIYNDDIQLVNSQTVRYVDEDGDLVTVKITKGALTTSGTNPVLNFQDVPNSPIGGKLLVAIDFTGNPASFNGTSLSVTADAQPGFAASGRVSDGFADVGVIQAAEVQLDVLQFTNGIDLTNVTIEGDLGKIFAGDLFLSPAIRGKLSVQSFGTKLLTGVSDNVSGFLSRVNAIDVAGDVGGTIQVIGAGFGNIGNLNIGGALRGGSVDNSGLISVTGTIGRATIGEIVGGSGEGSGNLLGSFTTGGKIGSVNVLSGITGGTGANSGRIFAPTIGEVTVGTKGGDSGHVTGGSGSESGIVAAGGRLGKVSIFGDLVGGSGANSGEVFAGGSMGAVRVGSIIGGSNETAGSIVSRGSIQSVSVFGDIVGGSANQAGSIQASGSLGSLSVNIVEVKTNGVVTSTSGGNILGGDGDLTGIINVSGNLSKVTIDGELRGGSGGNSGEVFASGNMGAVKIGTIIGGSGVDSGSVVSRAGIQTVDISRDLTGGSGLRAGSIQSTGEIGRLNFGAPKIADSGDITGGSGQLSGAVTAGGIGRIEIAGDIQGGTGAKSGGFDVTGEIRSLDLSGSLLGGSSTEDTSASSLIASGFVFAKRIGQMDIGGRIQTGENNGIALVDSASIRVSESIGSLTVRGAVIGNADARAVIAAGAAATNHLAIGSLTVFGDVSYLDVLGGYGLGATAANPLGNATGTDAQINSVRLEGENLLATNIVAGARPGADGRFGTADDETIAGTSGADDEKVISTIAKILIAANVGATDEAYGVVAQQVKSFVGGAAPNLEPGPGNDFKPIGGSNTFQLKELAVS